MKRFYFTILALLATVIFANAQDYQLGVGVRGGLFNGFTAKYFMKQKLAVEGIIDTRWGGFDLTALAEIQDRIPSQEGLNWYFGGGAHIGFYSGRNVPWANSDAASALIGFVGVAGVEYNFDTLPLSLGIDWMPTINLGNYHGFWADRLGISVRYMIGGSKGGNL